MRRSVVQQSERVHGCAYLEFYASYPFSPFDLRGPRALTDIAALVIRAAILV